MGAVLAFLDVARRDPGLTDAGREPIERALQAGSRVRTILRQLLDFSRPPRREPAVVDVGAVARETAALFSAQQRYAGHELQVQVAEGTPAALADRGQVAQILLNLLINAGDACAGSDAPRIEVSVRGGALRTRRSAGQGADSARRTPDGVVCRVADDGPGVEPGHRERIFDPFFTTKFAGRGLGLAAVLGIVRTHGGGLRVDRHDQSARNERAPGRAERPRGAQGGGAWICDRGGCGSAGRHARHAHGQP